MDAIPAVRCDSSSERLLGYFYWSRLQERSDLRYSTVCLSDHPFRTPFFSTSSLKVNFPASGYIDAHLSRRFISFAFFSNTPCLISCLVALSLFTVRLAGPTLLLLLITIPARHSWLFLYLSNQHHHRPIYNCYPCLLLIKEPSCTNYPTSIHNTTTQHHRYHACLLQSHEAQAVTQHLHPSRPILPPISHSQSTPPLAPATIANEPHRPQHADEPARLLHRAAPHIRLLQ